MEDASFDASGNLATAAVGRGVSPADLAAGLVECDGMGDTAGNGIPFTGKSRGFGGRLNDPAAALGDEKFRPNAAGHGLVDLAPTRRSPFSGRHRNPCGVLGAALTDDRD